MKLITGTGLPESNELDSLTLNIYQYQGADNYYTDTTMGQYNYHPEALTRKASFQNLLTVETVPKPVSFTVTKSWDDADDQDGIRPDEVTIKLFADGEDTGKTVTLSADNEWTDYFTELDKYKAGKEISYTVEEVSIDGYESSISGNQEEGYTITNSRTPDDTTPKTVDDSSIIAWGTLMTLAVIGLCAFIGYRRRLNK